MESQLGSRSSRIVFARALAMVGRLVKGEATRAELIDHVRATVEDAYERGPFDSFVRDLRLLRNLGFCIRFSRGRGTYRLERLDHPVLQLHLSRPALEALALLKATFRGLPHQERVEALNGELSARLPEEVRRKLDREPLPRLAVAPADHWWFSKNNLVTVEKAIDRHQVLEFLYRSPKRPEAAKPKYHRVEPYNLEYRDGHLYFEGYNLKTGKVYPYRIDRIVPGSARILPDVFTPREGIVRTVAIRYRLSPEIARFGASLRFRNQQEERQDDGSVIVTGEVGSLFEAMTKLLRYGRHCQVLEPRELVDMMRKEAEAMVGVYSSFPASEELVDQVRSKVAQLRRH